MDISSPAFNNHAPIPSRHTCVGDDVSPPIRITNSPDGVVSYAIIVEDPDAPGGTFVHWVAWNFSGSRTTIAESETPPNEGKNDFNERHYRGPCPPPGAPHHYHFKVYALDTTLNIPDGASKQVLLEAMEGHILEQAELVGTFKR